MSVLRMLEVLLNAGERSSPSHWHRDWHDCADSDSETALSITVQQALALLLTRTLYSVIHLLLASWIHILPLTAQNDRNTV